MRTPRRLAFAALAAFVSCSCTSKPYAVAQVSGRVTLDGKPLSKASISFLPMARQDSLNPGPTAIAVTDADGRYSLTIDKDTPGTVVGKCRIYITTINTDTAPLPPDQDSAPLVLKKFHDRIPEKYNTKTELTFDVPPEGTDRADFDLKSR